MFLHVSVILFTWGGVVSQHALQVVSQHALQQISRGGGIPACIAGFQALTRGEVEGSGQGGSPGPHPRGKLRGLAWGVSRPTPGGLQAHTWGGLHTQGVCIPACTEADIPQWLLLQAVCILLECILVLPILHFGSQRA